ncbi:MAG: hypothetical protein K6E61_09410 [Bacteroidales bacterium]|nr:hypothetical protein [Bacteroidales bacterium]
MIKVSKQTVGHEYTKPCCEIVYVVHELNILESSGMDDIVDEDLTWNLAPGFSSLPDIF